VDLTAQCLGIEVVARSPTIDGHFYLVEVRDEVQVSLVVGLVESSRHHK
jgi:hypothetical protein